MGFFSSKNKTINLEPMLTDEQKQAQTQLMNLGQLYDLSGFDFNMTPTELTGNNILSQYLSSGTPQLDTASSVLTDMANTQFNPDDPSSGFAAYKRQVARATKDADDVLNREAAITGSRYGTSIGQNKADLAAQQSDMLASKLAELYNTSQDRALSAAGGLLDVQNLENSLTQNKLMAAYQYGSLQRDLTNQKAQLAYEDWQRAENERVSGLNSVWGRNVDYGMKSYTQKSPSTFMSMVGEVIPAIGSYNTHEYGYTTNQTSINQALQDMAKMFSAIPA